MTLNESFTVLPNSSTGYLNVSIHVAREDFFQLLLFITAQGILDIAPICYVSKQQNQSAQKAKTTILLLAETMKGTCVFTGSTSTIITEVTMKPCY